MSRSSRKQKLLVKVFFAFVVLAIVCSAAYLVHHNWKKSTESQKQSQSTTQTTEQNKQEQKENLLSGKHAAIIKIKNFGTIKLELDADVAPITVTNFAKLANSGFYDGTSFHRIIKGFMAQGGEAREGQSEAKSIVGEFALNGRPNSISHLRGTISMARAQDPNSASSQFFICDADSTFLDGNYAAFGKVTEGLDVLDAMIASVKPIDDNGTITKDQQPIIENIHVD